MTFSDTSVDLRRKLPTSAQRFIGTRSSTSPARAPSNTNEGSSKDRIALSTPDEEDEEPAAAAEADEEDEEDDMAPAAASALPDPPPPPPPLGERTCRAPRALLLAPGPVGEDGALPRGLLPPLAPLPSAPAAPIPMPGLLLR